MLHSVNMEGKGGAGVTVPKGFTGREGGADEAGSEVRLPASGSGPPQPPVSML